MHYKQHNKYEPTQRREMEMEKRQGKLWNTEKENESEKESEEASKRIKK